MISERDLVSVKLSHTETHECIKTALHLSNHVEDRADLHARDSLERFINILMGELAEQMVMNWLAENRCYAKSAVDKRSASPDMGHDIELKAKLTQAPLTCSVKSSISYKLEPSEILKTCKLASRESEIRDINIQVYFWLSLNPKANSSRVTVPSIRQSAIIGWFGRNDITSFERYQHEAREVSATKLEQGRSLQSLLHFIS